MKLETVVPWGRSFDEYCRMFKLEDEDLQTTILGCADGPASFNAELTARGGQVVSADPIYQFSRKEIEARIAAVYPIVMNELSANQDDFIWDDFIDVESLGLARMRSMQRFLDDYESGIDAGRYLGASLPFLPFEPQQFRLALVSHYLFLYSDKLEETDHIKAVNELCRVAEEVRIYPLVDLQNQSSPHLLPLMSAMSNYGFDCRIEAVDYQFQRNASHMLRIRAR